MNCVLFVKMDQVFSKENKTLKILENWKKSQGKIRGVLSVGKNGNPAVKEVKIKMTGKSYHRCHL